VYNIPSSALARVWANAESALARVWANAEKGLTAESWDSRLHCEPLSPCGFGRTAQVSRQVCVRLSVCARLSLCVRALPFRMPAGLPLSLCVCPSARLPVIVCVCVCVWVCVCGSLSTSVSESECTDFSSLTGAALAQSRRLRSILRPRARLVARPLQRIHVKHNALSGNTASGRTGSSI
jgi:hypothetical protein